VDYDLVVAKDGSGNYTTVQAAINAAPSNRTQWYTIYIKNGSYREVVTVPAEKPYLRLVGQSASGTILTYGNYASGVGSTAGSASAFLKAKNFIAKNLTFENSFDYPNSSAANKQAVAAEPLADRQVYVNCRFTGYQDTLYVKHTGRNYFKDCFIQGHTDFIFGEATAVFDQCEINSRPKNGGCISAPSTLAGTTYGLIFMDCDVTGTSTGVWLGRPWHPSSSTQSLRSMAVYLYCNLGSHIATDGWTSMSGVYPSTERMYEYSNSGAGAKINSARPQLSASQAANYTVTNILRGSDNWDPQAWAAMQ
jgi:pectinesterase